MKNPLATVLKILAAAAAVLLLLEAAAFGYYSLSHGQVFSWARMHQRLGSSGGSAPIQEALGTQGGDGYMPTYMLHPYLGFIIHPEKEEGTNRFGFKGPDPFRPKGPDTVRIGIFGGSVAYYFYTEGREEFLKAVQSLPAFAGKKIELFSTALGGYKQPQQLMMLNYLLSLGADFDILINIDGLNEALLPFQDNTPQKIFYAYPRNWTFFARKAMNMEAVAVAGKMAIVRRDREAWKKRFNRFPWKWSVFSLMVWDAMDQRKESELRSAQAKLEELTSFQFESKGPQESGPYQEYTSAEEFFRDIVTVWSKSSQMMFQLAQANGITYLHFLQPNQHYEGSKKLTPEEKELAGQFSKVNATAVSRIYQVMRRLGQGLRAAGLPFYDLTLMYQPVQETIYRDSCCHLNERGNRLLIQTVANVLQDSQP